MFTFEEKFESRAKLKVIGVGGAGGNAVNRMVEEGLESVEFIALNTDAQDLDRNKAHCRIQVGERVTKGLGAGAKPDLGRRAVEEDKNVIMEKLEGADMVFITAGMGGGTGTGGAPAVAGIAREMDILTVAIVTRPFMFEGPQRMRNAEAGIQELRKYVDTIIVIPNQRLLSMIEKNTPMLEAFQRADDVLTHATRGISDLINVNGLINIDFADAVTVMRGMGDALMGTGYASGENMARTAAEMAVNSPLLEDVSIKGAKGVLINITGGQDMPLHDVSEVSNYIYESIGEDTDANIIIGAVTDPNMQGQIRVTVIATGFSRQQLQNRETRRAEASIAERVNYMKKSAVVPRPAQPELPLFKAAEPPKAAEKAGAPKVNEIDSLVNKVEKGMDVAEAETETEAEAVQPAQEHEVDERPLYEEVKKEMEAETAKTADKENRIKKFSTVRDIINPEDLKSSLYNSAIKNVGEKLCKTVKKDKFGVKNGLLSSEVHDDLDVPTFLRQQMD
jgi:cell division protein FtsZ